MSYRQFAVQVEKERASFARDVFQYLRDVGKYDRGSTYFGSLACNDPNLVKKLKRGSTPGVEVRLRVRLYMEQNPPETVVASKSVVSG